jgi:hypothetical protein
MRFQNEISLMTVDIKTPGDSHPTGHKIAPLYLLLIHFITINILFTIDRVAVRIGDSNAQRILWNTEL